MSAPNCIDRALVFFARAGLRLYQWIISPLIHTVCGPSCGCRFHPTCSEYAREAFKRHGFFRGFGLSLRRVLRCHPWSSAGHDPVPQVFSRSPMQGANDHATYRPNEDAHRDLKLN